jgi:hypothetical protein
MNCYINYSAQPNDYLYYSWHFMREETQTEDALQRYVQIHIYGTVLEYSNYAVTTFLGQTINRNTCPCTRLVWIEFAVSRTNRRVFV